MDKSCPICEATVHPLATYCKRCKRLLDRIDVRAKHDREARVEALKSSWDGECFRCYYSGTRLIDDNHHDPRYITFDHRTPRREDDIVVCAAFLNDMKSDLSESEFRSIVIELASRFSGGCFDESVLSFEHWTR
jgi:hypothetical protein